MDVRVLDEKGEEIELSELVDDDDGPVLNTLDEVDTATDTLAAFPEEEELPEEEEDESDEEYLPEDEEDDFAKEFENTEYDEGKDDFDL